jgi:phytoene dehydrogenase-like protein
MAAAAPRSAAPGVVVVGGGVAGLTAALRLAERGYRVTL